jgi:hypothetical protein
MPTIVVLGMHRSGTSCVARALHEGGMYLGDKLMNQVASDNLEGHWEAWNAVQINDDILTASGAQWHRLPLDLTLAPPEGIDQRIEQFLEELAVQPVHGFKDPRTLITFPVWEPHLSDARIVACLRHPYNVATSLARRVIDWRWEQGLELWMEYNLRLLHYTSEVDPAWVYWFDFDAEASAADEALRGLITALGLQPKQEHFNSFLRHHDELPRIEDPRLAELYDALRERARSQRPSAAAPRAPAEQTVCGDAAASEARRELRQMRLVSVRHDELIQRQQASIWTMSCELQQARARCEDVQNQCSALAEQHQQQAQHQQQYEQNACARQHEVALRLEELGHRDAALELMLQVETQSRTAEQQTLQVRLEADSQSLRSLQELALQQQAINAAANQELKNHIEALCQRAELLAQQKELLLQQNGLLAYRVDVLEQRLFWPMVARKLRAGLDRVRQRLVRARGIIRRVGSRFTVDTGAG